jgi:DNA excision repair protein ERCC-3
MEKSSWSSRKTGTPLRNARYWVESLHSGTLQFLLKDAVIGDSRVKEGSAAAYPSKKDLQSTGNFSTNQNPLKTIKDSIQSLDASPAQDDHDDDDDDIASTIYSFEIDPSKVETVKRRCIELDYPMLEEYDFRNDKSLPAVSMDLKPSTTVRPYQERSLSKMFGNGRARNGIIVLPCGAGKTLVGITAACTVKKSTLVLCTSA